jgi:hypothetical protein
MKTAVLAIVLLAGLQAAVALKLPALSKSSRLQTLLKVDLSQIQETQKPVIIEIVARKTETKTKSKTRVSSTYGSKLYKESKQDRVADLLESPLTKVFTFVLNPVTLCFALYFTSIAWSQVSWLQRVLAIFNKGALAKKTDGTLVTPSLADQPFQVYECEVTIKSTSNR